MSASALAAGQVRTGDGTLRLPLLLEIVALAFLLGMALTMRMVDLEGPRSAFPDLFDEGIRYQQLLLMENGFRPFRDIYAAQGLLLLDLLYPFFVLFGGTLGAIRLAVGLLSILGLIGVWWVGRLAGGAIGGLISMFLLVASPAYLEASRLALAEVPSLVPCLFALGCALRWQRGGAAGWLYVAAGLATIGVLIKPMAGAVIVPLALLALLRPGWKLRQLLIATAIVLGIVLATVLVMGPAEVYQQIVQYRVGASRNSTWELRRNLKEVVIEPLRDVPGLFLLAGVGGALLLIADRRSGLALVSWPLATIGMLLLYPSLHPKHLVYLYPPLVLLGGAGLGQAARLAWAEGPAGRSARLMTVGLAAVLATVPFNAVSGKFVKAEEDDDLHVFDRAAAESLALLTGRREFVLTDHPYVAALSGRLVPPSMVDPSRGRTRAGVLTATDAIAAAEQHKVPLVLIWADRLRRLDGFPGWLERSFLLSHVFGSRSVKVSRGAKDRAIYLRRDGDLATARARLEGALAVREQVDFDGKLRLLGTTISSYQVSPREQFTVTFGWEALAPMTSDYHVTLQLLDPAGDIRHEQEHDLEGSARGTSTWEPGRWLFRTFAIEPEVSSPGGEYRVQISVVDPKNGRPLRPTVRTGGDQLQVSGNGVLTVAHIEVD